MERKDERLVLGYATDVGYNGLQASTAYTGERADAVDRCDSSASLLVNYSLGHHHSHQGSSSSEEEEGAGDEDDYLQLIRSRDEDSASSSAYAAPLDEAVCPVEQEGQGKQSPASSGSPVTLTQSASCNDSQHSSGTTTGSSHFADSSAPLQLTSSQEVELKSMMAERARLQQRMVAWTQRCATEQSGGATAAVDWNAECQRLLEIPDDDASVDNVLHKYRALSHLSTDFVSAALTYARVIVSEKGVPSWLKTIPPDSTFGGTAGGEKFCVSGILFKFACDTELRPGQWLYGGNAASPEKAAKSAGAELKGHASLSSCNVSGLSFALMALVDWLGWRLVAMSVLPLRSGSLMYGSCNGGAIVQNSDPGLSNKMKEIGCILNLASHRVGNVQIHGPGDIEAHRGSDGRFYVLDLARLFPPEQPDRDNPHSVWYELLRPELVRMNPKPLCSDAFTNWMRHDANRKQLNNDVALATNFLYEQRIPAFAEVVQEEGNKADHYGWNRKKSVVVLKRRLNLIVQCHRNGVNVRHLGRVRELVTSASARCLILSECMARVLKCHLRRLFRQCLEHKAIALPSPFQLIAHRVLTLLLSHDPHFWRVTLPELLSAKFRGCLTPVSGGGGGGGGGNLSGVTDPASKETHAMPSKQSVTTPALSASTHVTLLRRQRGSAPRSSTLPHRPKRSDSDALASADMHRLRSGSLRTLQSCASSGDLTATIALQQQQHEQQHDTTLFEQVDLTHVLESLNSTFGFNLPHSVLNGEERELMLYDVGAPQPRGKHMALADYATGVVHQLTVRQLDAAPSVMRRKKKLRSLARKHLQSALLAAPDSSPTLVRLGDLAWDESEEHAAQGEQAARHAALTAACDHYRLAFLYNRLDAAICAKLVRVLLTIRTTATFSVRARHSLGEVCNVAAHGLDLDANCLCEILEDAVSEKQQGATLALLARASVGSKRLKEALLDTMTRMRVRKLSLPRTNVNTAALEALVTPEWLTSLDLSDCSGLSHARLGRNRLTHLTISCLNRTDQREIIGLVSSCCATLVHLGINQVRKVDDTVVNYVLQRCTQLQHLDMSVCARVVSPRLVSQSLRSLHMAETPLFAGTSVFDMPNLTWLDMSRSSFSPGLLRSLPKALRYLKLSQCTVHQSQPDAPGSPVTRCGVGGDSVAASGSIAAPLPPPPPPAPEPMVVDVVHRGDVEHQRHQQAFSAHTQSTVKELNPIVLEGELVLDLPELLYLDLYQSPLVLGKGTLITPKLQSLLLSPPYSEVCPCSGAKLQDVFSPLSALRTLYLHSLRNLKDKCLSTILTQLPHLRRMQGRWLTGLSEPVLSHDSLHTLVMAQCTNMTAVYLSCPRLSRLCLVECEAVDGTSLCLALMGSLSLTSLWLDPVTVDAMDDASLLHRLQQRRGVTLDTVFPPEFAWLPPAPSHDGEDWLQQESEGDHEESHGDEGDMDYGDCVVESDSSSC